MRKAEKIETKRCRLPGDRKRCIVRSRFRSGKWEFSARLFNPLCDRCSTFGITWRKPGGQWYFDGTVKLLAIERGRPN